MGNLVIEILIFRSFGILFTSPDTWTFFDHGGGAVWDLNVCFFLNGYLPANISKIQGGQFNKNTLNMSDAAHRAAVGTIPAYLMRDGITCADGAPMLRASIT